MIESIECGDLWCLPTSVNRQAVAAARRATAARAGSINVTPSAAATHLLPSMVGGTASRPDVVRSGGAGEEPIPIGSNAIAWAARALRHNEMPPEEIGAVLGSDSPELVHRYMELHRERLEERLADQLRDLAGLERSLVQAILAPRDTSADTRTAIHELECSSGSRMKSERR